MHNVIGPAWGWIWRTLLLLTLIGVAIFALYCLTEALDPPPGALYPGDY